MRCVGTRRALRSRRRARVRGQHRGRRGRSDHRFLLDPARPRQPRLAPAARCRPSLAPAAAAVVLLSSGRWRWLAAAAGARRRRARRGVARRLGPERPQRRGRDLPGPLHERPGSARLHREDPTGGLTTVVDSRGVKTPPHERQVPGRRQRGGAHPAPPGNLPTLFTAGRERALVFGLGTGVTLASLAAQDSTHRVRELSAPIVEAGARALRGVNAASWAGPPSSSSATTGAASSSSATTSTTS